MSVRIVAVDDEPGILYLLESIVEEMSYAELVGSAQKGRDVIEMVKKFKPDVVFMDIDLPDMNGVELTEKLKDYDPNLYIVFITAHCDFSLDAYRLYAYDYIVKPIDEDRLKTTLRRIQQLAKPFTKDYSVKQQPRITVRDEDEIVLVNPDSIYYVEIEGRKAVIHTADGCFETSETLNELEHKLGSNFFRSHKSYLINVSKVDRILTNERLSSYQIKFKNYPTEALLRKNRVSELFRVIKS